MNSLLIKLARLKVARRRHTSAKIPGTYPRTYAFDSLGFFLGMGDQTVHPTASTLKIKHKNGVTKVVRL